jgi:putative endonuclease
VVLCKDEQIIMHHTYVLLSLKDKEFYIGYTNNIEKRFQDHLYGKTPSTNVRRPFELIYYEAHLSKKDVLRREKYFKSTKGRTTLKQILRDSLSSSTEIP